MSAVSNNHLNHLMRIGGDAPRHGAIAIALCAVAALWVGIAVSVADFRSAALAGATLDAENIARALDEHVALTVRALDWILLAVRRSFGRDRAGFAIAEWAEATQALTELTPQLAITDRRGIVVDAIDRPTAAPVDLSDREHFRVLRESAEDTLFIGKPTTGRASRRTVLILARKLLAPDGSFDGIVFISLDAEYLARFYRSMDLGRGGFAALVGTDGIVRARDDGVEPDDAEAAAIQGNPAFLVARRGAASGSFTADSIRDGTRRIYAFRQLAAHPLVVLVGIAEADALHRYRAVRDAACGFGVIGSLLILAVLRAHLLHARNLLRVHDELAAARALPGGHRERSAARLP